MIFFLLLGLVQISSAKHFKLILKSRWVKGTRLKNEGFEFRGSDFSAALDDLKNHSG
ncbi:MAG: DUF1731 domain-containing protein [Akkermansiaceae bacterium]|nr:DUF1731 domain-containing protein [Akkermansiaceae bacterium]